MRWALVQLNIIFISRELFILRVALSLIVPFVYLVGDALQKTLVILEALIVEIVLGVTYVR